MRSELLLTAGLAIVLAAGPGLGQESRRAEENRSRRSSSSRNAGRSERHDRRSSMHRSWGDQRHRWQAFGNHRRPGRLHALSRWNWRNSSYGRWSAFRHFDRAGYRSWSAHRNWSYHSVLSRWCRRGKDHWRWSAHRGAGRSIGSDPTVGGNSEANRILNDQPRPIRGKLRWHVTRPPS